MARISPPDPQTMTARQREVHDAIASGPRGKVRGPLAVWLHRPELADAAQALGRYCRYDTLLEPRLSELAILTIARIWGSEFEWWAHKPIGLKAGLSEAVVETIRTNGEPVFERADEAIVHEFTRAVHTERKVSDDLYARAVSVLGEEAVVDLAGILGYYALISLTINVFDVDVPDPDAPRELV
ncbi:carboxymuconolactone decarboxylase family protein [Jiella mangrovi]|uniref:Carboxymuconolactone decarboxylase family protein n=1 Tax=Jiella mangrovi TaxID=2821407 RepID=A0ABS4BJE3_9HYPH|nr:carboxymuconolactone decarboxylase family protein [Jiella mangrovi]MBP0616883.1 carboxymuconolactone decarboxylase family protein [Jiella mangrovi]